MFSDLVLNTKERFFDLTKQKFNWIRQKCNDKHNKKFDLLLSKKHKHSNLKKDDWVKNFTETIIPNEVIDIVSLGPDHSVSYKFSKQNVIDTIKNLEPSLLSLDIQENLKNEIREKVTCNINNNLKKQYHISNEDRIFSKKLKTTKIFFFNYPDIFFTNADKGNVTVCLQKSTYYTKMLNLLSDTSTYTPIKKIP